MTEDAAYHEGYRRALEEVAHLVTGMQDAEIDSLARLLEELDKRIERARCLGRSSLASRATGDRGF
jgi:hypothetical protein